MSASALTPEVHRAIIEQADRIERQLSAECDARHRRSNERAERIEKRLDDSGLMTTETRERVLRLETLMATMNDTIGEVRDEQREARAQGRKTMWFTVTTLVGVIVTLALKLAAGL